MVDPLNQPQIDLVDEVLSTARSVRRKLDYERPVPRQLLLDSIAVAVQAPTGIAGENWRFLIVDAPEQKAQIAKIYSEVLVNLMAERGLPVKPTHKALIERLHEIPAMIFVCVDGLPVTDAISSQVGYYGSILPAAWSLMLALRARGLGTTWTTLLSARQEAVKAVLNMPAHAMQTVMLPVAYTKDAVLRRAERLPPEVVTYANRWNHPVGGRPTE
jgi:nitroreductase